MADETYNGWSNKATWLVKLWIDNEQGSQEYWHRQAHDYSEEYAEDAYWSLGLKLQEGFEEGADTSANLQGIYADLMTYALACVNWDEVAKALIEDAVEVTT